mmetsp:Transcript_15116/g.31756  ORF Transcript_15116/g.31756 Transcript_15116/m.31756 type:complete len:197 (+) Transcript_15116:149-739(+)
MPIRPVIMTILPISLAFAAIQGSLGFTSIITSPGRPSASFPQTKQHEQAISLPMVSSWHISPSLILSYDESIPVFQAEEAFQDQVALSDLASDPGLQAAFAASAIAIIVLFGVKAVVSQMDDAVERVAVEFDKTMMLKYPKKWRKFIDEIEIGEDTSAEELEADRIQRIVEEMERLGREEPEFMERVMRDIKRLRD